MANASLPPTFFPVTGCSATLAGWRAAHRGTTAALSGFESADYLLVPLCPTSVSVRKEVLEAVTGRGVTATEVHRAPLYVLYEIAKG